MDTRSYLSRTKRALAMFLSLALALCLVPTISLADEEDDSSDVVYTLTVVAGTTTDRTTYETSYTIWVNQEYTEDQVLDASGKSEGDTLTMEDLLDTAVAEGDLTSYSSYESYGSMYLESVTSADGSSLGSVNTDDYSTSLYWSLYDNGEYASTTFDAIELVDDGYYQLAYDCYTTVSAPSDWTSFYEENVATEAEETDEAVYTLTVVAGTTTDWTTYETSYTIWVNKEYTESEVLAASGKSEGDTLTMEDLLDTAVAAGDLTSYSSYESYGSMYLDSISSSSGTLGSWNSDDYSASLYWSLYDNGEYASTTFDAIELVDGGSYQLAYDCYTTVSAPSDWTSFYAENPANEAEVTEEDEDESTEEEDDSTEDESADEEATNTATEVSDSDLGELMTNIAESYAGTSEAWKVMELAAADLLTDEEAEAYLEVALADMADPDATSFQRNIIALTAAGYDATALPDGDETYDAVADMASRVSSSSPINVLAFTLLAYASGPYEVPEDANLSEEALINAVLAKQLSNGGFAYSGSEADADMTAMVIAALAPYADEYLEVQEAIDEALEALKALQLEDGGFASLGETESNANSTAMVVVALCALGIDPAGDEWATEDGSTPMSALLSQATSDLTGFVYNGVENDLATEQGFRALVAYQGLQNTGSEYNIYTQAVNGEATFEATESEEDEKAAAETESEVEDESETEATEAETSTSEDAAVTAEAETETNEAETETTETTLAETGDTTVSGAVSLTLVGAGAALIVIAERRRRRAA